mmetsp:Transcript_21243/g.18424  ORF Transcript_21243/g.18424 Transcript_21243/m.18424 type:complete len:103 (-) Transcript_21243:58-366(-)
MFECFELKKLYQYGANFNFLDMEYIRVPEEPHFKFRELSYVMDHQFRATINHTIETLSHTPLPAYYNLQDLTFKIINSLDDSGVLNVNYSDTDVEIKAKIFH